MNSLLGKMAKCCCCVAVAVAVAVVAVAVVAVAVVAAVVCVVLCYVALCRSRTAATTQERVAATYGNNSIVSGSFRNRTESG